MNAITRPCPTCKAPAGSPCVSRTGRVIATANYYHVLRVRGYRCKPLKRTPVK